jgi:hypothetical protein
MLARYPGLLSGPNQASQPVRQPNLHRFTAGAPRTTGEERDVDAMRQQFVSLRASIREHLMDGTFLVGETGAALGLSPERSSTGPFSEYDDQEEEGEPSEHEMEAEAQTPAYVAPPPPGVLLAEHSDHSPFRPKPPRQAVNAQQPAGARYSPDPQGLRSADAAFVPATPMAAAASAHSAAARVTPSHATVLKSPMLASVSRMPPSRQTLGDDDDDELVGSFGALRDSLRGLMQGRYT